MDESINIRTAEKEKLVKSSFTGMSKKDDGSLIIKGGGSEITIPAGSVSLLYAFIEKHFEL